MDNELEQKVQELVAKRLAEIEIEKALQDAQRPKRLALVASKGSLDMAYPPLILASTAVSLGWEVGVFEKQPSAYPLPRAVHLDQEVARILQAAGLGEELARLSEPADVYEWKNAAGETLLLIGSKEMGLCGWPEANMFSQPELERALDARVRALPSVEVNRGCEVVGIRASSNGVALEVASADGARREVRAGYAVGCDGANSFVRRHLGVAFTDLMLASIALLNSFCAFDGILRPRRAADTVPETGRSCFTSGSRTLTKSDTPFRVMNCSSMMPPVPLVTRNW
jgi:hypothetical protein